MIKEALLVGAGGFAGSVCRYMISYAISGLPWVYPVKLGTLTVNILGSLLIGVLMAVVGQNHWYYISIAGFCGGFTTFSAFSAETLELFNKGYYTHGIIYIAASVLVCLFAVWAGMQVGLLVSNRN